MSTTIAFFGGSVPAGVGFSDGKQSKSIYPNLIAANQYNISNCSYPGSSNYEIFISCCNFLANYNSDIVVVEWNTFHRWRFYPKFDLEVFISATQAPEMSANLKTELGLSNSDLKRFQKYLINFSNDYKSILDLLDYCCILQDYAKSKNVTIVMLNGNTPWTKKMFQNPENIEDIFLESDKFTRSVLHADDLDDKEVLQWWSKIYKKYKIVNLDNWVCFTDNLSSLRVDSLSDGHPGPLSHEIYAEKILYHIKGKI